MLRRYPSLLLLVFVIAGILVADGTHVAASITLLTAAVFCLLGLFAFTRKRHQFGIVLLALSLGAVSAAHFGFVVYDLPATHISHITVERKPGQIFARVVDWPDLKPEHTEILLEVDSLGGTVRQRTQGRLLLKITDTTTSLQRGDRVEFVARIYPIAETPGQERFDYGRYLNLRGVFGIVYLPTLLDIRIDQRNKFGFLAVTDRLRNAIRNALYADLSPEAAALASGFLIGETRDIPTSVYQRFRDSGTLHLMAVSGSNVAVVLFFFYLLLQPLQLSRTRRAIVLLIVVVVFATLSYGEPSVLRASLMAALVVGAGMLQRRYDLNNIIALAMLIILLVQPTQLFDVGFQLSFATAWGLIFIVPRLTSLFRRYHNRAWYRWLAFPVIISGVAQVCSAPIIGYYFERIPIVSVAANLIIVPLASIALVGILILLLAHLLLPALGVVVGVALNLFLSGTLLAVNWFGHSALPSLSFPIHAPTWIIEGGILAFYAAIVVATFAIYSKFARRLVVAMLLLLINAGLLIAATQGRGGPDSSFHISSIPGGVAAIYLRDASTSADLIITNIAAKPYAVDERVLAPFLKQHGIQRLDRLFLMSATYPSLDDVLRLALLANAEHIYIPSSLSAPAREVIRDLVWPDSLSSRIEFYGGHAGPIAEGYHLSGDGVRLIWPGGEILFTNSQDFAQQGPRAAGNTILVMGRDWKADSEDWTSLHQIGYSRIICAKVAHPSTFDSKHELTPEQMPPDYLTELIRSGEVELPVGLLP